MGLYWFVVSNLGNCVFRFKEEKKRGQVIRWLERNGITWLLVVRPRGVENYRKVVYVDE